MKCHSAHEEVWKNKIFVHLCFDLHYHDSVLLSFRIPPILLLIVLLQLLSLNSTTNFDNQYNRKDWCVDALMRKFSFSFQFSICNYQNICVTVKHYCKHNDEDGLFCEISNNSWKCEKMNFFVHFRSYRLLDESKT